MEDKQIISLYHARDERAIKETDAKYGRYCYRIAKNLLTLHEDAEECVSDTYLAAWNQMPPENPHLLSAFLSRIVRNIAISRFRRDRAKKRHDGVELLLSELDDCIPSAENVEKTVEERELSNIISDWLDTLTGDDRALYPPLLSWGIDKGACESQRHRTASAFLPSFCFTHEIKDPT